MRKDLAHAAKAEGAAGSAIPPSTHNAHGTHTHMQTAHNAHCIRTRWAHALVTTRSAHERISAFHARVMSRQARAMPAGGSVERHGSRVAGASSAASGAVSAASGAGSYSDDNDWQAQHKEFRTHFPPRSEPVHRNHGPRPGRQEDQRPWNTYQTVDGNTNKVRHECLLVPFLRPGQPPPIPAPFKGKAVPETARLFTTGSSCTLLEDLIGALRSVSRFLRHRLGSF